MLQFYVVINTDFVETVYTGSLEDCALEAEKLARKNPGREYVYCKVSPVGVHCHPKAFDNIFPVRPEANL